MRFALISVFIFVVSCAGLKNSSDEFRLYIKTNYDDCEAENDPLYSFCQIDLDKNSNYYLKHRKDVTISVFVTDVQKFDDWFLVKYDEFNSTLETEDAVFIIYDSEGKIKNSFRLPSRKNNLMFRESNYSVKDSCLKVFTFDSLDTHKLDHMYTPFDWKNPIYECYKVSKEGFKLHYSRAAETKDWALGIVESK